MSMKRLRRAVKAGISDARIITQVNRAGVQPSPRVIHWMLDASHSFAGTRGRYYRIRLAVRGRALLRTR